MKFDVITVGSGTIDLFIDPGINEKKKELCFPLGDKLVIEDITFTVGGGGTNTAVGFSRQGLKTGYIGCLGDGHNGERIIKELKKENVNFLGVKKRGKSGYSVILTSKKEKRRTILTYKGVNDFLKVEDINLNQIKTDWLYLSSMMNQSFKAQKEIVSWARKNGAKIAFNPSNYQAEKGIKQLKDILKETSILVLNKEESELLIKKGDPVNDLRKHGPEIVCVTNGENGSKVCDGKFIYVAKASGKSKCVERTGAGDAFASGFVSAIIKGNTVEEAIRHGSANAESVIESMGAKFGLLDKNQLKKRVMRDDIIIRKKKISKPQD